MNSTFDLHPVVTQPALRGNGHDPAAHLSGYDKRPLCRLERSELEHVESERLVRELLYRIGDDPNREGLQETPARVVRSWRELFSGYSLRPEDILVTQFHAERYDEMVLLRGVEFYSTCEHHMLSFRGQAHVAYIPDKKIVGLSKLARLVDIFARRLQIQERLTQQIAEALQCALKPKGVAVMIEAKHQCMCCRGVRKQRGKTITSSLIGSFKEDAAVRTEFLSMVRN